MLIGPVRGRRQSLPLWRCCRLIGRGRVLGPQGRHLTLDLDELGAVGNQDADLEESRVAVDTNAISVERKAGLSLSLGDGGGQQLSCRCWRCDTAHWTQPRRKTD